MRKIRSIFWTIVLASVPALAEQSEVRISKSSREVVLSREMREALSKFDSKFKPRSVETYPETILAKYKFTQQSAPSAIFGDFNGDGKQDAVLHGVGEIGDVVYQVLSQGKAYVITQLGADEEGDKRRGIRKPKARPTPDKEILDLYGKGSEWKYRMRYLVYRPIGSSFDGAVYDGMEGRCPFEGVGEVSNSDGTRELNYCFYKGHFSWDGVSGD